VRLEAHEPLAYVTGCTEFRGHAIHVNDAVLVPRPETEELVQTVLNCTPLWDAPRVPVVDAGTGSGCIAVSLALEAPSADVLAVDSSEQALQVARRNVLNHDLAARVTLRKANWLQGIDASSLAAVVANPPYVTESDWAGLAPTVRNYEPRAALLGGPDGLSTYRRLVPEAFRALRPGGWLFLEIGASQARRVEALVAVAGFSGLVSLRDLQGLHRIVAAQKP
jgi:release factor glutamine methyltransferase